MMTSLLKKVRNRWKKIRLQPIHVYCLHHVCKQFDADAMNVADWMDINEFKRKINELLKQGYKFISLTEAYGHLRTDYIRRKKYAVLTFDDGYKSLQDVLPWLEEQYIPATLFINGKYLDGVSYRKNANEKYLTHNELFSFSSPFIEIGSHGYEHIDASKIDNENFRKHIDLNLEILQNHPCYVPFHAYTWGRYTNETNDILKAIHLIPVYVDGMKNYNEINYIHREML